MLNEDEIGIVIGQISKRDEAGEQRNCRDQRDLCCTNDHYCTPSDMVWIVSVCVFSYCWEAPKLAAGCRTAVNHGLCRGSRAGRSIVM